MPRYLQDSATVTYVLKRQLAELPSIFSANARYTAIFSITLAKHLRGVLNSSHANAGLPAIFALPGVRFFRFR